MYLLQVNLPALVGVHWPECPEEQDLCEVPGPGQCLQLLDRCLAGVHTGMLKCLDSPLSHGGSAHWWDKLKTKEQQGKICRMHF